jgi:long-chain fatty acid transport protein
MRSKGSVISACMTVLLLAPVFASASGFYVPSVGSAAGAMGGAFVGLADDYSAVHWNPAGIIQISGTEATVSAHDIVFLGSRDGLLKFEDLNLEEAEGYEARQSIRATAIAEHHFAPGVFLYSDGGPLGGLFSKVGLCAYTLAEYGVTWDGEDVADQFVSHPYNFNEIIREGASPEFRSRIRGYVVSPVVARKFSEKLSIGVTGHALYAHFELEDGGWVPEAEAVENPPAPDEVHLHLDPYQMTEDLVGWGYGATIGVLYQAGSQVSVGLSARTPITVDLEGTVDVASTLEEFTSAIQNESMEFTFPMWVAVGLAYEDFLFDGTTLTLDYQWTQWSAVEEFSRTVDSELPNGLGTTALLWEDTNEIGLGMDWRLSRSTSVRFGYRWMDSPVPDDTFDFVMPMYVKSVYSAGVGYRSDVWSIDASLVYESGEKRRLEDTTDMGGTRIEDKNLGDALIPSLSFTYGF